MGYFTADTVTFEPDEWGWEMHIETAGGERLVVNVQGCAHDLLAEAQRKIGPGVREAAQARATMESIADVRERRIREEEQSIEDRIAVIGDTLKTLYREQVEIDLSRQRIKSMERGRT